MVLVPGCYVLVEKMLEQDREIRAEETSELRCPVI